MPSKDRCIVAGCRHRKMADSVYCGNKCVERHAFASLELIRNERGKMFGASAQIQVCDWLAV